MKYNKRQQAIINFARTKELFQTKDVFENIWKDFEVKRLTIVRDLKKLQQEKVLKQFGSGRSVNYSLSRKYRINETIAVEPYFAIRFQQREILPFFNQEIFDTLSKSIFTTEEIKQLEKEKKHYNKHKNTLSKKSPAILKREWERLIIELSWKSSEIEGNTYTLLETEILIKDHQLAKGKNKTEAQMILNHKKALDYIFEYSTYFSIYNEEKVKKMHSILVDGLDIRDDFRNHPVWIGGTLYRPLQKQKDISNAMKQLTKLVVDQENPYEKAFIILIMISYIQPFEDGNKRTSRIVSNAILYAYNCPMLSYRDVDVIEYKKAALLFYEQNNISYFKKIFIEQFSFSAYNYFQ